jgi:DNA-binding MarR family transcriptional regulator
LTRRRDQTSDAAPASTAASTAGKVEFSPDVEGLEVEAVMVAARVLVAVSARSIAAVEDEVTLPQLRVLVMVASAGPLNLGAVAAGLGVHPSNGTRVVERLVKAGLLDRRDDPADRRTLLLELTDAGRGLVERVMADRRAAIAAILESMPASRRRSLVPTLRAFAAAGGEVSESAVWSLGWTTSA